MKCNLAGLFSTKRNKLLCKKTLHDVAGRHKTVDKLGWLQIGNILFCLNALCRLYSYGLQTRIDISYLN